MQYLSDLPRSLSENIEVHKVPNHSKKLELITSMLKLKKNTRVNDTKIYLKPGSNNNTYLYIKLNRGKFLINRKDRKILKERSIVSALDTGSSKVTIGKSKIFRSFI